MKLKTLIKKLKGMAATYGGDVEIASGDHHEPLGFAETYYNNGKIYLQFKVDDPKITDHDCAEPDEAITRWICSNIKLIPEGIPEELDFWEVATKEIIRLGIPENIAPIQSVEVHLDRKEIDKPDVVIININHGFGSFEGAFFIKESLGNAVLSKLPAYETVEA